MADQTRTDIKTAGGGTFTGGTYGDVTFNGSGTMNGDVDAITFRVNGAGTSNGRVKAQSVTVNGTAGFNGEVQASEFVGQRRREHPRRCGHRPARREGEPLGGRRRRRTRGRAAGLPAHRRGL